MSDHHHNPHEGNTAADPMKIAIMVVVGAAALIVGIVLLARYAVGTHNLGATVDNANTPAAVSQRIAPLTTLVAASTAAAGPSAAPAMAVVTTVKAPSATAAIVPTAAVAIPAAAPVKVAAAASGENVYKGACGVCHAAGIAGAPKSGDKAAWGSRIAKGKPTLYEHAIKGFNAMPAKGGNSSLADADVKAAVDYMVALAK